MRRKKKTGGRKKRSGKRRNGEGLITYAFILNVS